jgi:hypothetical protein
LFVARLANVLAFAPRIPQPLLEALARLDDRSVSIAETNRRLGEKADRLGITRPSYERVRELIHRFRLKPRTPSIVSVGWRVAGRAQVRALELFLDCRTWICVRRRE